MGVENDKDELLEEGYEPIGGFTEWLVDGESMKIQILEKDDDIRYVDKTGSEIDFDGGIVVP